MYMILMDKDTDVSVEAFGPKDIAALMRKSLAMNEALNAAFNDVKKSIQPEIKIPKLPADMEYGVNGDGYLAAVKRNKQVDVPTEAWQKSIERKLDALDYLPECHTNSVNMIRRIEKRLDKITDVLLSFSVGEPVTLPDGEEHHPLYGPKYHKDLNKG